MRVLVVTNAYPTAAAPATGIFVKEQVESLAGAEVQAALLHVDRTNRGRRAYRGLGPVLRAKIDEVDPDIIHVMYGGVMADLVTRAVTTRPIVVSFCGNDLLGEGEAGLAQRLAGRYTVWCSHRAARRARAIIVKSRGLLAALPRSVDRSRVSLLPNGVDIERFAPQDARTARDSLGWSSDRRHLLFPAATSRPEKRFWLARAAVDELSAGGVDVELHALDGVARTEVPTWLNATDAVILTSAHEGSPNVIKEALACNVAVVSVDVGDVGERIQGIAGCFLAKPTASDLAEKLRRVMEADRIHSRDAVAALSLPAIAERLVAVYARAAG